MRSRRLSLLAGAILLVITLAALPFISACAKPAPAEVKPIELKLVFAYVSCPSHWATFGTWADNVQERTGGRVTVTHYFGGDLCPPEETYDAVKRGTADIGISCIEMMPGRFPNYEVMEVALLNDVCARPSRVAWEMYNAFPQIQEECAETKVLATLAMLPFPPGIGLGTAEKPVRTLGDYEGLKLSAYGRWMPRTLDVLGAAPMDLPPPAFYEALQKGIIDGVVMDPVFFDLFHLSDVIHYYTVANFGVFEPWIFSINWDTWNSLPPDIQKVLEEESVPHVMDASDDFCWEDSTRALQEAVDNFGVEVIEPSPEELARWVALQKPVQQDVWKAEAEAAGLSAEELLEEVERLYEKYRTR